jgi:hypothetical protein
MRKAQSQILGSVLIMAIVLLVSGTAFIWGKPLIDKSTDKSKIDNLLLKMDEIDASIKQAASTGSSKKIRVSLKDYDEISITKNGEIKFQTYIKVPVISTKDYAPLNSYELAIEKELLGAETNLTVNLGLYPELKLDEFGCNLSFDVKNTSMILESKYYNVLLCVTSDTGDYDVTCIVNDTDKPKNHECAKEYETISLDGINYVIQRIDRGGTYVYFTGSEVENIGIIARDVPGVISGKSRVLGTTEGLLTTLLLKYRGLIDNKGVIHRIILDCNTNCLASGSDTEVKIVRTDVVRTGNSIDTYINVELT